MWLCWAGKVLSIDSLQLTTQLINTAGILRVVPTCLILPLNQFGLWFDFTSGARDCQIVELVPKEGLMRILGRCHTSEERLCSDRQLAILDDVFEKLSKT